LLKENYRALM